MKTSKETFGGSDILGDSSGRSGGLEKMVREEVAQQVADVLRTI